MKTKLLIFLLVIPTYLFSQNLVKNPGFEILSDTNVHSSNIDITKAKFWTSPSVSSASILRKTPDNATPFNYRDTLPYTNTLFPHTGKYMCQINTYGKIINYEERQYIQGELTKTLIKGKTYKIEFWIAKGLYWNQFLLSNHIGIVFLKKKFYSSSGSVLPLKPHFSSEISSDNLNEWFRVSWNYLADDEYKYFIIGNFFPNKRSKTKDATDPGHLLAQYLLDDISIKEIDSSGLNLSLQTIEINKPIPLNNVNFEPNKTELLESSFAELQVVIDFLQKKPNINIEISGHTDNTGNNEANLILSRNRAKAVYDYLVQQGINSERLSYKGYGSSIPKVNNDTPDNRAINRRVEFKIVKM